MLSWSDAIHVPGGVLSRIVTDTSHSFTALNHLVLNHLNNKQNLRSLLGGKRTTEAAEQKPHASSGNQEELDPWVPRVLGGGDGGGLNPPHTPNQSRAALCVGTRSNPAHILPLRSIQRLRTLLSATLVNIRTIATRRGPRPAIQGKEWERRPRRAAADSLGA